MLTVKQAADVLGVSSALVYALCASRRIRHERHGLGRGTIKIPEDAIAEYRRSVTVEAQLPTAPKPATSRTVRLKHLTLS
jgi:excisionase family DNA binding protein